MINIDEVIRALAVKRPVFHSEADFQHALAWEVKRELPDSSLRLEFRPPQLDQRIYLDIWGSRADETFAIELKYKTRRLSVKVNDEEFVLLDQAAQDLGRYDFIKDIERLEQLVVKVSGTRGFAVFLTNDSAYWKVPRGDTIDADFRIHHGKPLSGNLSWRANASKGTTKGRENPIFISGSYKATWEDYSRPSEDSYGEFRYLSMEIKQRP